MLDPERPQPNKRNCYPGDSAGAQQCDQTGFHSQWKHADSWDQVREYLEAGAYVADRDGDLIDKINKTDGDRGVVHLKDGGAYEYAYYEMLLENVQIIEPATPEEEAEALASIFNSIK